MAISSIKHTITKKSNILPIKERIIPSKEPILPVKERNITCKEPILPVKEPNITSMVILNSLYNYFFSTGFACHRLN